MCRNLIAVHRRKPLIATENFVFFFFSQLQSESFVVTANERSPLAKAATILNADADANHGMTTMKSKWWLRKCISFMPFHAL